MVECITHYTMIARLIDKRADLLAAAAVQYMEYPKDRVKTITDFTMALTYQVLVNRDKA
ncbi:MAG: hypothetical protein ABW138_13170 [Candidatus Thiodiazotropha sp. 4PDIVS1]